MLEVAVGDVALGVVGRDQPRLDFLGERLTPEVALAGAVVLDSPHPRFHSIRGSQEGRFLGHDVEQAVSST